MNRNSNESRMRVQMGVQARAKAPAREKVRQARHGAYRDLILEAAQRVFAEKGYGEAKVADIAQAAGVATGTVYAIFPGKQDLYRAKRAGRNRVVYAERR